MDLDIEYVARLARINLTKEEKGTFSKDLGKILDHFKELQELNTQGVLPMTGGTSLSNVMRKDEVLEREEAGKGVNQFPEDKDGYLKVQKVFA